MQYRDRSFAPRQSYPRKRLANDRDQQLLEREILYQRHSKMIVCPFMNTANFEKREKKALYSNQCVFAAGEQKYSRVLTFT